MREVQVTLPELALLVGTRAALGPGSASCWRTACPQRQGRRVDAPPGRPVTTVPLAFEVLGKVRAEPVRIAASPHDGGKRHGQSPMYPLRFEPIFQYRIWGGRRLAELLTAPLPGDGPIGEAWLLSDRDDHPSKVADGPLKGSTIRQLLEQSPDQIAGKLAGRFRRFPVLLKFLDAREKLSVQVHPADGQRDYIPAGETGKTEAWVVLEVGPDRPHLRGPEAGHHARRSRAGRSRVGRWRTSWQASRRRSATPSSSEPGPSTPSAASWCSKCRRTATSRFAFTTGIVLTPRHASLGPCKSSRRWPASISSKSRSARWRRWCEEATPVRRERLFHCEQFSVWRHAGQSPFTVGAAGTPRVLVSIGGDGELEHRGTSYPIGRGDVVLLPAEVGACSYRPQNAVSLLEVALPE